MIRFGLIGYPLNHTLSPRLHQAALRACDLQGEYSLYPVPTDDSASLVNLLNSLRAGELTGLNVTIPYKQTVIRFLDELTPVASAISAVNTLYLKDGRLVGDNTDAPAFLADLAQFINNPQSSIVLGAGGAAHAVVYALRSCGCEVTVLARRVKQAHALAKRFANIKAMELNLRRLRDAKAQLIVNATPVGMFPEIDRSPWLAEASFPETAAIYDLIYNPYETLLVKQARAAGLKAITGLGMLIEQAALAFELWTGYKIQRGVMLESIQQRALSL
jgi:shikimate dehydrogenase